MIMFRGGGDHACNFHTRQLCYIRPLITKTVNVIACSIVGSRLDYCNSALNGIMAHNISCLQHAHKSLTRIVCCALYRSSTKQLHHSQHWLPIYERIALKVAVLIHKIRHHHQPTYLLSMTVYYIPTWSLHSAGTNLLVVLRTKTITASKAFRAAALMIWYRLPLTIRSSHSYHQFPASTQVSHVQCGI